jgi:hypothetical protein
MRKGGVFMVSRESRQESWNIALGWAKMDNVEPSDKCKELARQYINGEISVDDALEQIISYHRQGKKEGA